MRTLTLTVAPEQAGRTVKSLLRRELRIPEGMLASLKWRETGILRNGQRCRVSDRAEAGDEISVEIGDPPAETGIVPRPWPLVIPYEDEDLLVLDKPAGMATHGKAEKGDVTAAAALAARWGADRPFHPVSRLDRDTSGLMVVAKSGFVHQLLRTSLHSPDYERRYLAILQGTPPEPEGSIRLALEKDPERYHRIRVSAAGLPARTDYRVLETRGGLTLAEARLFTGRTHQIRVHFAALGCPLAGDTAYGGAPLLPRPALHSAHLTLTQPLTGAKIELDSPMPGDMEALWTSIR